MARRRGKGYNHDKFMARALDDLAAFDALKNDIAPELLKMLKDGASADDIYTRYEAMAAARTVTIVAREIDSGKALAAIKEIRDRSSGKAKEQVAIEHKYSKLKDEQLDSVLMTALDGLEDDDVPLEH